MRLALFQPDIAPNVGALIRLGACLDVTLDIIEPCGFPLSDKSLKRVALDYSQHAHILRHADWAGFAQWRHAHGHRLILAETHGTIAHTAFRFAPHDIILLGRESAGTPSDVAESCDAVVRVPMRPGVRSLNVAMAATLVLGEALRQTEGYPC